MPNSNFKNNFVLEEYNSLYHQFSFSKNSKFLELFLDFINDDLLLNKIIEQNDKKSIPPAVTFVEYNKKYFKSILNKYKNNKSKLNNIKQSIGALWSYLFLHVNGSIFNAKFSIKNTSGFFLSSASIFIRRKIPFVIENVYFQTKSCIFNCSYNYIIEQLFKISDPFKNDKNVYDKPLNCLISQLLEKDEIRLDMKVAKYDGKNIEECLKREHALFLLKKDLIDELKLTNILSCLKEKIISCREYLTEEELNILSEKEIDENKLKNIFISIKNKFKKERFVYLNYYSKKEEIYDNQSFNNRAKKVSELDDVFDAYSIVKQANYHILIYLNKFGILNLIIMDSSFINDEVCNNNTVEKASHISEIIENRINAMAKVFNFLNLNKYIKIKKKKSLILGLPYAKKYKSIENDVACIVSNQIYKNNNLSKTLYSRLTFDHKKITPFDKTSQEFFEYVSLFVSFSHVYDKMSLTEYIQKGSSCVDSKKIDDLSSSKTKHIYHDDSLFTYFIVDQSSRYVDFQQCCKKDTNFKEMQSHQYRLYSLWEFASICGALIFGTSSILTYNLLTRGINRKSKAPIIYNQHLWANVYSRINLNCNHLVFNSKGRNFPLINQILEKMGLVDVENKAKNAFDANWQYANITNVKFYQRLGTYLSLSSLCVSLIAFAWAGAVFIDSDVNGYKFDKLFSDFGKAHKFYFVLIVALIPLLALFVSWFVVLMLYKCINSNIAKYVCNKIKKDEKKLCDPSNGNKDNAKKNNKKTSKK